MIVMNLNVCIQSFLFEVETNPLEIRKRRREAVSMDAARCVGPIREQGRASAAVQHNWIYTTFIAFF